MADGSSGGGGGGGGGGGSHPSASASAAGASSSSLDGGLLLRLLQNPPQSQLHTQAPPLPTGPHFFDPAVAAVGPLFPSSGFPWPSSSPSLGFPDPRFAPPPQPLDPYAALAGASFGSVDGVAANRAERPRSAAPPPGFGKSSHPAVAAAAVRDAAKVFDRIPNREKRWEQSHQPRGFGGVPHREQHMLPNTNAREVVGGMPHREQQRRRQWQDNYLSRTPPNVNTCEAFGGMPHREWRQQELHVSKTPPNVPVRETCGRVLHREQSWQGRNSSKVPLSANVCEVLGKTPHQEEQSNPLNKLPNANTHEVFGRMPLKGQCGVMEPTGHSLAVDESQEGGKKKVVEANGLEDAGALERDLGDGADGGVKTEVRKLEVLYQKSEVRFADHDDGEEDDESKEEDATIEQLMEALVIEGNGEVKNAVEQRSTSRSKDFRSDFSRGHNVSSQRVRMQRRNRGCRYDIDQLTPKFLSIFESLVPSEEEIAKQKQLLTSLSKLINKEWPDSKLYLYGSCANSFGFSNSDIDLCLSIDDKEKSKVDIILKLADILEAGNLQNVQALTRARVPIVKLMDPDTGLSCDICVNNLLAVVNTKLLKDYAMIDKRLRQLAFIVKHWAKSRRVNETYQGTLSSYAYVIMCIHLLQLRRILPCLQEMEATYFVTVDDTKCAYFDRVDMFNNYGAHNKECVARLLWAFFHYWAYQHDYTRDVISIRTGRIISKQAKDWTRRVGNDRHLICIEDPFETTHDLGRVVDKFSIKILREEFERAANILQYDPNPTVALFDLYVPPPLPSLVQEETTSTAEVEL